MNFKKRFTAMALSAVMLFSQAMPTLAADVTSTEATGNVLAYASEVVTVPTKIQLSFNPDKYQVSVNATEKKSDQIVALNYGVASEATMDKIVKVGFEATYTERTGDDYKAIEFVSENGVKDAKAGEYKVYLAVATDASGITASDNSAFGVDSTTKKSTASANALADVKMTAATKGVQAFVTDGGKTTATVAVSLNKAAYTLSENKAPTFDTTQDQFADMVVLKTLGGTAGFTFVGSMNENANWTKANTDAIKITPKYEITDATGEETHIDGTGKQVEATASATSYLSAKTVSTEAKSVTITKAGATVSSVVLTLNGANTTLTSGNHYTVSGTTLTFSKYSSGWAGGKITVKFGDEHEETLTCQ